MSAPADAFLQGQGVPVALADIESELTQLWGPAAEQVGGPELEHPAVTRVVLANLLVVAPKGNCRRIAVALDELSSRHPCRMIVLRPGAGPGRKVEAEVAALCHLPAPGQPQVCSERITLTTGPEGRDLLPGSVRPLLEPDLPVILWWADAPAAEDPLFRALATDATRVLLDPPGPVVDPAALGAALDPARHPCVRDLAWFGLPRWRGLIASLFDPPAADGSAHRIAAVEIAAVAPEAGPPPREAAWLAAWLAGQLGWERVRRASPRPGTVEATFRGSEGEVAVRLSTRVDPAAPAASLRGVTISTRGEDFTDHHRISQAAPGNPEVHFEGSGPGAFSHAVVAAELDTPRRIAAALDATRDDPPFLAALPHALWLLGA